MVVDPLTFILSKSGIETSDTVDAPLIERVVIFRFESVGDAFDAVEADDLPVDGAVDADDLPLEEESLASVSKKEDDDADFFNRFYYKY